MLTFLREFAIDVGLAVVVLACVGWWFSPKQRKVRAERREENEHIP
jgi:hypothetical protein